MVALQSLDSREASQKRGPGTRRTVSRFWSCGEALSLQRSPWEPPRTGVGAGGTCLRREGAHSHWVFSAATRKQVAHIPVFTKPLGEVEVSCWCEQRGRRESRKPKEREPYKDRLSFIHNNNNNKSAIHEKNQSPFTHRHGRPSQASGKVKKSGRVYTTSTTGQPKPVVPGAGVGSGLGDWRGEGTQGPQGDWKCSVSSCGRWSRGCAQMSKGS